MPVCLLCHCYSKPLSCTWSSLLRWKATIGCRASRRKRSTSKWHRIIIKSLMESALTKVGEGQFGEVYKAVLKTPTGTSQDVAVKVVKKGTPQEERLKLLQEAAILGQFRHRHVVDLKGIVRDELVRTHAVNGEGSLQRCSCEPIHICIEKDRSICSASISIGRYW